MEPRRLPTLPISDQANEINLDYKQGKYRLYYEWMEKRAQIQSDPSLPTKLDKLIAENALRDKINVEFKELKRQRRIRQIQIGRDFMNRPGSNREFYTGILHSFDLQLEQLERQRERDIDILEALSLENELLEEGLHNSLTEPFNDLQLD